MYAKVDTWETFYTQVIGSDIKEVWVLCLVFSSCLVWCHYMG
jgi:hypothetical protein